MDDTKETGLVGYVVGVVIMIPFFWFTFGDAYGRFSVSFDPANSSIGHEIQPITRAVTGLVCFAMPLLLAYLPRYMIGRYAVAVEHRAGQFSYWALARGKKLAVFAWKWLVIAGHHGWNFLQKKRQEYRNK